MNTNANIQSKINISEKLFDAVIDLACKDPIKYFIGKILGAFRDKRRQNKIKKWLVCRRNEIKKQYPSLFTYDSDKFSFIEEWLLSAKGLKELLSIASVGSNYTSPSSISVNRDIISEFVISTARSLKIGDPLFPSFFYKYLKQIIPALRDYLFEESDLSAKEVSYLSSINQSMRSFFPEVLSILERMELKNTFREIILSSENYSTDYRSEYNYRNETFPFIGRKAELGMLNRFISNEKKVLWWSITGGGGLGKSRLALEFITKHGNEDWKMMFLQKNIIENLSNYTDWSFPLNLLLVIDYAEPYAQIIADFIMALSTSNTVISKFRILLIDRGLGDKKNFYLEPFQDEQIQALSFSDGFIPKFLIPGSLGLEDYIELSKFSLYRDDYPREKIPNEQQIHEAYAKLEEIDAQKRTLYFRLILDAILENEDWRAWKHEDLVRYIVRKENNNIEKRLRDYSKAFIKSYKRLLLMSTFVGGIGFYNFPEFMHRDCDTINKKMQHLDLGEKKRLLQLDENNTIMPVTPDIIGEYYFIWILHTHFIETEILDVLGFGYDYNKAFSKHFIYMCAQDDIWIEDRTWFPRFLTYSKKTEFVCDFFKGLASKARDKNVDTIADNIQYMRACYLMNRGNENLIVLYSRCLSRQSKYLNINYTSKVLSGIAINGISYKEITILDSSKRREIDRRIESSSDCEFESIANQLELLQVCELKYNLDNRMAITVAEDLAESLFDALNIQNQKCAAKSLDILKQIYHKYTIISIGLLLVKALFNYASRNNGEESLRCQTLTLDIHAQFKHLRKSEKKQEIKMVETIAFYCAATQVNCGGENQYDIIRALHNEYSPNPDIALILMQSLSNLYCRSNQENRVAILGEIEELHKMYQNIDDISFDFALVLYIATCMTYGDIRKVNIDRLSELSRKRPIPKLFQNLNGLDYWLRMSKILGMNRTLSHIEAAERYLGGNPTDAKIEFISYVGSLTATELIRDDDIIRIMQNLSVTTAA